MAVTQEAKIPARLAHWDRPAAASRRVAQMRKAVRLLLLYVVAGAIAAICLIPILWMVKTSFETPEFIRSAQIQFWPIQPTLQNYRDVLENPNANVARSMVNSILVAFLATLLNLTVTIAAGYCLSRFEFRGKLVFAMYLLLFYMIPRTLLLIGLFVMLARLHLLNNLLGLILVYAAVGVPLATWWLKGFFDSIPVEIEEQAMIDGSTRLGALRQVILPLAAPGLAAGCLLVFASATTAFISQSVIGGGRLVYLPSMIWQQAMIAAHWPFAATAAIALLVSVSAVIAVIAYAGGV